MLSFIVVRLPPRHVYPLVRTHLRRAMTDWCCCSVPRSRKARRRLWYPATLFSQ